MANHKLELAWDVVFADGSIRELEFQPCYHFYGQEQKYIVTWLEKMLKEMKSGYDSKFENLDIKKEYEFEALLAYKPVEIREKYKVKECDPYEIVIGV